MTNKLPPRTSASIPGLVFPAHVTEEQIAAYEARFLEIMAAHPELILTAPRAVDELVVEHAIEFSGGSMLVRPNDAEMERDYPLAKWIDNKQRMGARVYRRRVVIVEDWTEVEPTQPVTDAPGADAPDSGDIEGHHPGDIEVCESRSAGWVFRCHRHDTTVSGLGSMAQALLTQCVVGDPNL